MPHGMSIMPYNCYGFYDSLPHLDETLRKKKVKTEIN